MQEIKNVSKARQKAHEYFDLLWKEGHFTRTEAYNILALRLDIEKPECHIRYFDAQTCNDAIFHSEQILTDMRDLDRHMGA